MNFNKSALLLALAGAFIARSVGATDLPVTPNAAIPVNQYVTQVNADNSVTYRFFAPDAKKCLRGDWYSGAGNNAPDV
ncbi:xylanase [Salmonella enterica]|nr:xylanase [Salmonella enterica]